MMLLLSSAQFFSPNFNICLRSSVTSSGRHGLVRMTVIEVFPVPINLCSLHAGSCFILFVVVC